jgi:hypothetical protein
MVMTLIHNVESHQNFIRLLKEENKLQYWNLGPKTQEEWLQILSVLECFREGDGNRLRLILDGYAGLISIYLVESDKQMITRLQRAAERMEHVETK